MLSKFYLTNKDESEQPKMNKSFIKVILSIFSAYIGLGIVAFAVSNEASASAQTQTTVAKIRQRETIRPDVVNKAPYVQPIAFKHGDISWLPILAAEAGWPQKTWKRLGQIILRESGGCPTRTGGSIVDKNCNIIGHDGSNHRSDSGLLQINGVNWDPKRSGTQLLCAEYKICTQKPLLDAVTNLKAGYILYQKVGWAPWDPCYWGPAYADRCKKSN
jgi:hypothetical protein